MEEAGCSYLELAEACNTAIESCSKAAQVCAFKAREACTTRRVTHITGNVTSGVVLLVGLGLAVFVTSTTGGISAAVAGLGLGGVGLVTTHYIASEYTKSEASLRSIQRDFNCLMTFACDLKAEVTQILTNLESVSTQIDKITYCIMDNCSIILLQDVLKRLDMVCTDFCGTSRCKEVNTKLQELKIMNV